ncbi:hypothetical protein [Eubacterium sp.]
MAKNKNATKVKASKQTKQAKKNYVTANKNAKSATNAYNKFANGNIGNDLQAQLNALTTAETAYSDLINGGFSGFASANGLADYSDRLSSLLDEIQNAKFSYNADTDGAYQAYRQQYRANAEQALKDATGQYASQTGGYSSSVAQSMGNQAYQSVLGGLSDVQSQLMNLAYNKFSNDLNNKKSSYDMYNQLQANNYNQYQNAVNNASANMSYTSNRYNSNYNNQKAILENRMNNAVSQKNEAMNNLLNYRQLDQQRALANRNYRYNKGKI